MKLIIILLFNFLLVLNSSLSDEPLDRKIITVKSFIEFKADLFFSKYENRTRTTRNIPTMIVYQNTDFSSKFNEKNELVIKIKAFMDKSRYKKKKFIPKMIDCNSLRNKWITGFTGYNFFTNKKNYKVSKDNLTDIVKSEIYDIDELSKKEINDLLDKTYVEIEIVHPITIHSISCKGKINQVDLN